MPHSFRIEEKSYNRMGEDGYNSEGSVLTVSFSVFWAHLHDIARNERDFWIHRLTVRSKWFADVKNRQYRRDVDKNLKVTIPKIEDTAFPGQFRQNSLAGIHAPDHLLHISLDKSYRPLD